MAPVGTNCRNRPFASNSAGEKPAALYSFSGTDFRRKCFWKAWLKLRKIRKAAAMGRNTHRSTPLSFQKSDFEKKTPFNTEGTKYVCVNVPGFWKPQVFKSQKKNDSGSFAGPFTQNGKPTSSSRAFPGIMCPLGPWVCIQKRLTINPFWPSTQFLSGFLQKKVRTF